MGNYSSWNCIFNNVGKGIWAIFLHLFSNMGQYGMWFHGPGGNTKCQYRQHMCYILCKTDLEPSIHHHMSVKSILLLKMIELRN